MTTKWGTRGSATERLPQTALGRCPVCLVAGYLTSRGLMRSHDRRLDTDEPRMVLVHCHGTGQPMTERVR